MPVQHVPTCASTGDDIRSPLFHPLAVKSVLKINFGLYEVKSHEHWEIEEFNLGAFLLNVSLTKTHSLYRNGHFFGTLIRHERDTVLSLKLQVY
jgi:hypothetical protein